MSVLVCDWLIFSWCVSFPKSFFFTISFYFVSFFYFIYLIFFSSMLVIHPDNTFCAINYLRVCFEGIFESQFIEIRVNGIDIIIENIYPSPSGAVSLFLWNLEEILDIILKRPCQLIMMGDFNINLMDLNSSASVDFLSTMLAEGTLPTTSIPTWVTNVTASLIDNIFSTLSLKENSIFSYSYLRSFSHIFSFQF